MALIANNISGSASNNSRIGITGSVVFANLPGSSFPSAPNGVTFFVSGSSTDIGADSPSIVFKGDSFTSGAFGVSDYIQLKPVGSLRIPTNTSASYIYTSGSTNDLYYTQYEPGTNFTNTVRMRWLEGSLNTGLLAGGVLSTENGTITYSITSGSGIIVSYNTSIAREPYLVINYVKWNNIISSSLPSIGSTQLSYIAIDSTGAPVVSSAPYADGDFENKIILGRVLHQAGSVTNGAVTSPTVAYGQTQFRGDFLRTFGPIKISGHTFSANGLLGLQKDAGDSYTEGRNYQSNTDSPNYVKSTTDTAQLTSKIFYEYVNGSGNFIVDTNSNAGYTVIDYARYNNGGTLATVGSGNKFTIQRVFWFPNSVNRAFYVYYGNTIYATIPEAQAGIANEVFVEGANTKDAAIFLGYVIVKGTATDLSDPTQAKIIQAGNFRAVGSAGAGPTGTPGGSDTQIQFNDAGVFGGDAGLTYDKTTDSLTVVGNITGSYIKANSGLSGSLTKLANGTSYLIAGTNISITTGSTGAVTITDTMPTYFTSTTNGALFTTGSVAFVDGESATVDAPTDKGTDVFFYVSGSTATGATSGVSLFGGNVVISGSISGKNGSTIVGDVMEMTGSLTVTSYVNAAYYVGSSETITGSVSPGTAASTSKHVTLVCGNAASQVVSLGDGGITGQEKILVADSGYTGGATVSVTPTNLLGYTTITFNAIGDSVMLIWTGSKWAIVGSNSVTLA